MKKLFYSTVAALLLPVVLFMCSCSNVVKLTQDDKKNGVVIKSKRAVIYKGNLSKYSYFGKRKNKSNGK